jgi:hypothetical protein
VYKTGRDDSVIMPSLHRSALSKIASEEARRLVLEIIPEVVMEQGDDQDSCAGCRDDGY